MKPFYIFLGKDNAPVCVPENLVQAIGVNQYKTWKGVETLFHITNHLSLMDFLLYVMAIPGFYRDVWGTPEWEKLNTLFEEMDKHFGKIIQEYCIKRGVMVYAYKGDFVACMAGEWMPDSPHIGTFGVGENELEAFADLNMELVNNKRTSFIEHE